jgi:hypothetical protein
MKLWSLEHSAQMKEPWIQILIQTDDDLVKLLWLDKEQNQEK